MAHTIRLYVEDLMGNRKIFVYYKLEKYFIIKTFLFYNYHLPFMITDLNRHEGRFKQ